MNPAAMNPVTGLSLGRIAVGTACLLKPELVQQQLAAPAQNPLLTRWFGNREIALGVVTLLARGSARRNLVLVGMGVDAADAATAFLAVEEETMPRGVGLAGAGVAVGAVVSGLLGLRVRKRTEITAG